MMDLTPEILEGFSMALSAQEARGLKPCLVNVGGPTLGTFASDFSDDVREQVALDLEPMSA